MRTFCVLLAAICIAKAGEVLKCKSHTHTIDFTTGNETTPAASPTSVDCPDGACQFDLKRDGTQLTVAQKCIQQPAADPPCTSPAANHVICSCSKMNCNTPSVFVSDPARLQSMTPLLRDIGVTYESATKDFSLAVAPAAIATTLTPVLSDTTIISVTSHNLDHPDESYFKPSGSHPEESSDAWSNGLGWSTASLFTLLCAFLLRFL